MTGSKKNKMAFENVFGCHSERNTIDVFILKHSCGDVAYKWANQSRINSHRIGQIHFNIASTNTQNEKDETKEKDT